MGFAYLLGRKIQNTVLVFFPIEQLLVVIADQKFVFERILDLVCI